MGQIASQQSPTYVPASLVDKITYSFRELFSAWNLPPLAPSTYLAAGLALLSLFGLAISQPTFVLLSLLNIAIYVLILPVKWDRYLLPLLPAVGVYLAALPNLIWQLLGKLKSMWIKFKQFLLGAAVATAFLAFIWLLPITNWLAYIILVVTLLLIAQGYLVTRAMLHGFRGNSSPTPIAHEPQHSFSLIVPARDEAAVIGTTIQSLSRLHYPSNLYEVLVMIRADDAGTLQAANQAITQIGSPNIRIVPIDGDAHNKAYSLNIGLHLAEHEIIGIFDAEDDPHPEILAEVNGYLLTHPDTDVVQAPVHLTNLTSSWYSGLNAVEYYYWFRSVLPFLATKQILPLGGNTVFTRKSLYSRLGHYDETCLTEDADLGIRLASLGAKIGLLTDPALATREETPADELGVIRQRSRWDQGYLQVLDKANWQDLTIRQQFYALYTLTQPLFRHVSFLNMVFAPLLASLGHIPLGIALISFIPGYFLLLQLGLYLLGLADLGRLHGIKLGLGRYLLLLVAFIPYQALLALATFRALAKLALGNFSWDKTEHGNLHRSLAILKQ